MLIPNILHVFEEGGDERAALIGYQIRASAVSCDNLGSIYPSTRFCSLVADRKCFRVFSEVIDEGQLVFVFTWGDQIWTCEVHGCYLERGLWFLNIP